MHPEPPSGTPARRAAGSRVAETASPAPSLPAPWRQFVLVLLLALIALGLAWELVVAPTGRGTLALKVLPLVGSVPGVWRGRVGSARWLSLLVWLYFIEGVVRAWGDRGASQVLAFVSLALVLALFGAVVGAIRAGRRAVLLTSPADPADPATPAAAGAGLR